MIELEIGSDGIAEARFDQPGDKVNLLSEAMLARLAEVLDAIESEAAAGRVRGVTFTSAKPGIFLAGADVKAFVAVASSGDPALAAAGARAGQLLFSRIAALPVPTVAAVNGVCLGGGLEMALACASRLASDAVEVSIGLPEVRLGLIPGWGGTQRLPRLIGAGRALDLILTGRSLNGRQALSRGMVDAVVPAEGIARAARQEAARLAGGGKPRRARWQTLDRWAAARPLIFGIARRAARRQAVGRYPAPEAAIEAVRYGLAHGIQKGLVREAELCGRLLVGDVSRNLVSIFLATRSAGSTARGQAASAAAAAPAGSPAASVKRLGVLGAGTMGGGIAAVAAMAGLPVRLRDVTAEALARGMSQVRRLAASSARRGRLPRHETTRREAAVSPTTDLTGFGHCDLIVEAVVEDLAVKRQALADVERVAPGCIFATNTSSLSVADIAARAAHPDRVIGLHFFNPVDRMPLVEVVRAPSTDESVVDAAVTLARKMGKTPVVVRDTPGFIVNRILMPYLGGAMDLLAGGADVRAVDRALTRFGMPMGPFALMDQIGLDVAARVADVLSAAFPRADGGGPAVRLPHAMAQAGLLGAKVSKGFYRYPSRRPSPELPGLVAAAGRGRRTAPVLDETAIADALVDLMVNEAALLLAEGSVDSPMTIDLAMVMGTGFPPFRGGLLRHADAVGREAIAARLRARGEEPAPLLLERGRFHA